MTWTVGDLHGRLTALAEKVAAFDAEDKAPSPLIEPLGDIEKWADKHTNDPRNRSCMDRIEEHALSNESTYQDMIDGKSEYVGEDDDEDEDEDEDKDDDTLSEDTIRRFDESPLSVTRKAVDKIDVLESWGGPSDGYEVEFNPDGYGRIEGVRYYFRDWFDGAWLDIYESDFPATWRYLEHFTSYAAEGLIEVEVE